MLMMKKQKVGRPRGGPRRQKVAGCSHQISSRGPLFLYTQVLGRTHNNASPLSAFFYYYGGAGGFNQRDTGGGATRRSLTRRANIKTPGGISGCVCRGCRSGTHTPRALNCSLSMSKWATLTESRSSVPAELRTRTCVKGKCRQHPGLIWAQLTSCPRSSSNFVKLTPCVCEMRSYCIGLLAPRSSEIAHAFGLLIKFNMFKKK